MSQWVSQSVRLSPRYFIPIYVPMFCNYACKVLFANHQGVLLRFWILNFAELTHAWPGTKRSRSRSYYHFKAVHSSYSQLVTYHNIIIIFKFKFSYRHIYYTKSMPSFCYQTADPRRIFCAGSFVQCLLPFVPTEECTSCLQLVGGRPPPHPHLNKTLQLQLQYLTSSANRKKQWRQGTSGWSLPLNKLSWPFLHPCLAKTSSV